MPLDVHKWMEILQNIPSVISALLHNLSDEWTAQNEGENTWTVREVLAHLIVCEETNWLPRVRIVLSDNQHKPLDPIDMRVHFSIAQKKTLQQLIFQFKTFRKNGIVELKRYNLQEYDF